MRVDTKYNLSDSLFNDTQFLLNLDVMDYSLLVGFDEDTNEMIVGIVGKVFYVWNLLSKIMNSLSRSYRFHSNLYLG